MSAQLHNGNHNKKKTVGRSARAIATRGPGLVLPALAALGIGAPAAALELGPATVQSALGQPLRASIAFALRPYEQLAPYCIRVTPGVSPSGLPSAGPASVRLGGGAIHLTGQAPVSEPLLALQVTVDCPYAAHLSREYIVFVDPEQPAAEPAPSVAAPARQAPERARADAVAQTPKPTIAAGVAYRVQRGDTLSGIAERLRGRRVGLWQAAELLFAANPQAFVDNDPDRLRAGALLGIPDAVQAAEPPVVAPQAMAELRLREPSRAAADEGPMEEPSRPASRAYAGYAPGAASMEVPAAASVPAGLFRDGPPQAPSAPSTEITAPSAAARGPVAATPAAAAEASPQAGDVRVDTGDLFVSPIKAEGGAAAPAEATPSVRPPAEAPVPAAPPASSTLREAGSGAWSWLLWLAGSGVALILGLLLFGRTLKRRAGGGRTLALGESVARPRDEAPLDDDAELDADEMKVDFRFDDADAEARIVRVDVDLDDGSGFQETGDIDVAQDFGFSASGGLELGLDVDFSQESPAMLDGSSRRRREGDVIVEEEIPPGDTANSEYDLSMIVDATRQPLDDLDDTEKDLHAIELEDADAESEEDPFTLSREVDYKILEQDYEEELTVTQALAVELSNAARDLVDRLHDESGDAAIHELPTVEMPVPGTEPTAELPQAAPEARDSGTAASPYAGDSGTVEMLPQSEMAEAGDTNVNEDLAILADAGNDASADLETESATIDTKKLKAS